MTDSKRYPIPADTQAKANINKADYTDLYQHSIDNPEQFWAEQAQQFVSWSKPWDTVSNCQFEQGKIRWFEGAQLNVSYNCLDRHLETRGDQPAIIWEGDDPNNDLTLSYRELHEQVCKFANVMKTHGVGKGDRVCIYMPMIPEAAVAMLACTRIGAVHSVVFGGFSSEALRDRILDSSCAYLITADEGVRGGKTIPLKASADVAVADCACVKHVFVVRRTGAETAWNAPRDVWYHQAMETASADCPAEPMDAEDPLFILYTSGSTGKPKGILHSTGGYLLFAAITHHYIFDYHDGEIYWCTADVGWVTGHTYIVYGPLCNGATTLMFEGVPTYPNPDRFWQVVDKHQVNIFYTAPTAIRALMGQGDDWVKNTNRSSLRLLGSVGEPINPEAWEWYHHVVGDAHCPIVDTWWQTETGGILITPLPGAIETKPGSATLPFFGITPQILDNEGNVQTGEASGLLTIDASWPGQARSLYGDHERFIQTYFSQFPGYYFTGDGARRDADGYYWITGRVDDVLNVSGHRMGTAEVESALIEHSAVAESAVVGYPHDIKGQGIYAYVTLKQGFQPSDEMTQALRDIVRKSIGPIASPDIIQYTPALPKTRSGKIMRRILRKVAANEIDSLGDTSTLADPAVVEDIVNNRANKS